MPDVLGLSVPIADLVDPQKWRDYYGVGIQGLDPVLDAEVVARLEAEGTRRQCTAATAAVSRAAMPDTLIRAHLRTAASEAFVRLGIDPATERVLGSEVDPSEVLGVTYDREERRWPLSGWSTRAPFQFRIDMPGNVMEIERVRAFFMGVELFEVNAGDATDWILTTEWSRPGVAHIVPRSGATLVFAYEGWAPPRFLMGQGRPAPIPDFWSIDYTRGLVSPFGGGRAEVPANLRGWVYSKAGVAILSLLGAGRSDGVTSHSISIDGISESVGLQASAIYGLYSSLEEVMRREVKGVDFKALTRLLRGPRIVGF